MGEPRDSPEWIDGQVLCVTSSTERDSIIEAIRTVCDDPRFRPGLDLLIDARELERAPRQLSPPLVRGRAFEIRALGFRRCAVVAAPDPLQVSLANMFATYADQAGVDTRAFATIDAALSWLKIAGQSSSILSQALGRGGRPSIVTDAEARLARIRQLLRVLLAPTPLGRGFVPMEAWPAKWTDAQREAYAELRKEAEAEGADGSEPTQ
jgi:hypothetical protein